MNENPISDGGDPVPFTPPADAGFVRYDLGAVKPGPAKRPTGLGLFYAGAVNLLAGDPGGGKTFVALQAGVESLRRGGSVIFCDLEDDENTAAERFGALGATVDDLGSVLYLRSLGAFTESTVEWLRRLIPQLGEVVLIVDSLVEALSMAGLDEDRAPDVARWWQTVARPLADAGACVVIVDHLAKTAGSGGRWPRGSGHKLAGVDGLASILESVEPFDRSRSGSGQVIVAKDRRGHVGGRGTTAANVTFSVAGGSIYNVGVHHLAGDTADPVVRLPRPDEADF